MAPTLQTLSPETNQNETEIDIIFVHGLNPLSQAGHAVKTWTHADGTLWPSDLLPAHVPTARIMLFAYNANVARDVSEAGIRQHANDLLDLADERRQGLLSARPIIFICHSLGGLIVKQALLTARLNRQFETIGRATFGVVFFATPHRGGNGATIGQVAANVAQTITGSDRNDLVKSLQKDSSFLAHLTADFKHISDDYRYVSIVESRGIFRVPFRTVIVDRVSAELGLAGHREHVIELDLDHRKICKLTRDAVSQRILGHIKRLSDSAVRATTQSQSDNQLQIYQQDSSTEQTRASVSSSSPLLSTIDCIERVTNVGFETLTKQMTQWLSDDSPILVLHGCSGSGKTSIATEFAWSQRKSYSVFWFAAENMHNLQNWYNKASSCIDSSKSGGYTADHYSAVNKWLLDPAKGKWILIFDNANQELDFGEILPQNVPWGKVLITSRTGNINMGKRQSSTHLVLHLMPPLSTDDAFALFMRRCGESGLGQVERSAISTQSSSLRYNPFAVLLAGSYFHMFGDAAAIQSPSRDTSSDDGANSLLTLASSLIEESGMNFRMLLVFLFLLGGGIAPLEVINLCQRVRKRHRDLQRGNEFLSISNTGPAINHWTSLGLLQRQSSSSGTILLFQSCTATAIEQEISKDPEQTMYILNLSLRLLAFGKDEIGSLSSTKIAGYIEKTISSLRNLCTVARDMSLPLPRDSVSHLQLSSFYHLNETISGGRILFKKMFWRQWLSSFNYLPTDSSNTAENEFLTGVPILQWPLWLENELQESDRQSIDLRFIIQDEIVAKFQHELERATWLCGIGNTWFGVRTTVFDFARQNFHADFSESQKASFIDFVDKGGTAGVQNKLVSITRSQDFRDEVKNKIGSDAVEEIAQVVCAISYPHMAILSDAAIQGAVTDALENTMQEVFGEGGGVFASALIPIQDIIISIIEGSLEIPSNGENVEKLVAFGVSEVGGTYLRERCLALAEGFYEYVNVVKMWIAAKICLHLAYAAVDQAASSSGEVAWDWICAIIELLREGVGPVERIPGRRAQVAGRRMLFWLEEAHRCRDAWGAARQEEEEDDAPGYEFRNQALWEETRILMGAENGSGILS